MPNKKAHPKKISLQKKTTKSKTATAKPYYEQEVFIISLFVVVLILTLLVFRGWVRTTVIPKGLSPLYTSKVQDTLNNENTSLQSPLNKLGYAASPSHVACILQQAQNIHTEIDCTAEIQAYTKLPGKTGEANVEGEAQAVQTLLAQNGWHGGSNGVTLTTLIDGTYQGKDYSPDAYYEKVSGSYDCVFDTFIAYANPEPPAINTNFSCSRTANILGAPQDEFYDSSRGSPAYN